MRLLWLTLEKVGEEFFSNLRQRLWREPQQMRDRFKLVTGSQRRDEQDPIEIGVIVRPTSAYQASKASQMPSI